MAKRADVRPQGMFVLRTPLLPRDAFDALGDGLALATASEAQLDAAIAADRVKVRERLRELVAMPEVREAIFVASPSLESSIDAWLEKPDSENGVKTERGLVRYLSRMAVRPTPFGLFAGNTMGVIGETTQLELAPRAEYRRYTRLDGDYLSEVTDKLEADPEIRKRLSYRPNSSLCKVAGGLRYAMRREGADRTYSLVSLEPTDYLIATLERARNGALPEVLAQALCDADAEVTREEADEYVRELIDAQVLVSDLAPLVTGVEAVDEVIDQLNAIDAEHARLAAKLLADTRAKLAALDQRVGNEPAHYRAIHEALKPLPVEAEINRLFQVNLVPAGANVTLSRAVIDEVVAALGMLRKLSRPPGRTDLDSFKEAFSTRYEDREVPLAEVLDEESGIGFNPSQAPGADASPLLDGLPFPGMGAEATVPWTPVVGRMARRITEALTSGATEIVLEERDIKLMESDSPAPLPDALSTMITLATTADGDYRFVLGSAYGPSGANLLGRFCHSDEALHRCVREQLAAEEAMRPDAVFAEIVHLADGRLANISARPVLRPYEIVFLGRSGAPRDRQLPVTDLMVSVRGGRVVLRSASLDKEVLPRLTNAHNFSARSLGTYRFLATLQGQGQRGIGFSIGPLEALPYVPRIRYGRMILREASWRLNKEQVETITKPSGAARVTAVRALRAATKLPRWVCIEDGDNILPVDLDNITSLDSFLHMIKNRDSVQLGELWPEPQDLAVRGSGGKFTHEIVVPMLRVPEEQKLEQAAPPKPTTTIRRSNFAPGSEWLYAKLYTGRATADQVLEQVVWPIAKDLPAWFFIRYGDPDWHVRFRVHGDPAWLMAEIMPKLAAATRPMLDDGRLWKVQLDTYEREVARYGGPIGVELAEKLFWADSVAVAEICGMLAGDTGTDARWRLTLRGIDQLLEDLGFDLATQHRVMTQARDGFSREHRVEKFVPFQKVLGDRYRKERVALDAILDRSKDADSEYSPALEKLAARSAANAPIVAALREAEARGQLTVPIVDLAGSYVHMHANRLLRSAQRAHELVLYDLLSRLYESRIARAKGKAKQKA